MFKNLLNLNKITNVYFLLDNSNTNMTLTVIHAAKWWLLVATNTIKQCMYVLKTVLAHIYHFIQNVFV